MNERETEEKDKKRRGKEMKGEVFFFKVLIPLVVVQLYLHPVPYTP